jgi:hypothetical protein
MRVPIPQLILRDEMEGRGGLVGMDVLRGTILTVSADPARAVIWQVPHPRVRRRDRTTGSHTDRFGPNSVGFIS